MTARGHRVEEIAATTPLDQGTLEAQLGALGLRRDDAPSTAEWRALLEVVESTYDRLMGEDPAGAGIESLLGAEMLQHRVNYTNLFECAPIPILEHDYRLVVDWMETLRETGVEDFADVVESDPEAVRDALQLIRITAANPAACELFGAPASELIGPLGEDLVDDGTIEAWQRQLAMIWNGETRMEAQFRGTRRDGSRFDGLVSMSAPSPFDIPDYGRVVVSIGDITRHISEERRMRKLIEAKDQFLASVSHELRTPLTGVIGFAELLKEDSLQSDPTERRDLVAAIAEQAADVANIVEDLLVAARAELGELQVVAVPVNLTAQIAQVLEAGGTTLAHVETQRRRVEPRIAIADPGRVRQIVRNLLTNATRYGGSRITVHIRRRESTIFVSVIDDGDGLPSEDWERIFETYERSHSLTGSQNAVGIGLAISRELARLMGGDLTYRYEDDRSVFELSLPAKVD